VHDSYRPARLLAGLRELSAWAGRHAKAGTLLGASQDDPDVTPLSECRYDWCVTVEGNPPTAGSIGLRAFPGGLTATLHVDGTFAKVARAWDWLFSCWLPRSGYEPRDAPAREHYLDGGRRAPKYFDLLCVLPISRLG